jgi:CHRD domain
MQRSRKDRQVSFTETARRAGRAGGRENHVQGRTARRGLIRRGVAAIAPAVAVASVLAVGTSAGASTGSAATSVAALAHSPRGLHVLRLRAMPRGTVRLGRSHHHLTAHVVMYGLTPGSSHGVRLAIPGRSRAIRFSPLTANGVGQANSVLRSHYTGRLPRVSRLVIRMGVRRGRIGRQPIAVTRLLRHWRHLAHRLIAVEVSSRGVSYGTPRGRAAISYNARRHTLTVIVHATGITPGPHAAHIHQGSCRSQGPVLYMLPDLVANRHGTIARAVRVFKNVTKPIPARGWYLNIHQGNSKDILSGGSPTILFRPLLCRDIH